MRDGYGFNEGEMCFMLSWFGVHQSILHFWVDISVLLLWQCSWWFSSVPSGKSRFLTSLIGNTETLRWKCRGIGPHLVARGNSHEFSRVGAGTWCIFSSYGGDGHLKFGFVQRNQDSCLLMKYISWSLTMLGRIIQMLLEVSREAKRPLLVCNSYTSVPINFTKSQASSPFEALNSAHLSKSQKMWGSLSRRSWELWLSLGSPQGIPTSLHLVRWKMSLHLRHCRESRPSLESGHQGVHILEAENTESLSHTYFWGKAPLEVLVESWLTSSVKDRESFSFPVDMGCTEVSSSCSNEIDDPLYLRLFSQGISRVS